MFIPIVLGIIERKLLIKILTHKQDIPNPLILEFSSKALSINSTFP